MGRRVMVSIVDTNADGGELSTEDPHSIELGLYIELPVSSSVFMSLSNSHMSNRARSA